MKFTFFPEIEGDNVIASIELPSGATVERTQAVVSRLEQEAKKPAKDDFLSMLRKALDAIAPKNMKETEKFKKEGKAGQLKATGAVGGLRVYSGKMNKDASGQVVKDQSQRYAFTEEEQNDIRQLRRQYGDASDILKRKKLFTVPPFLEDF